MSDFHDPEDLALLQALIDQADAAIEASRPPALALLEIDARSVAARGRGRTQFLLDKGEQIRQLSSQVI